MSKDWQSDKLLPLQHLLVLLHPSSHGKTDTDKHWKHLLWPICVLCTANMSRTKRFSSTGTRHRPQLILIKSWTFNTPITSAMLIRMISFDLPLRKCKHKISDTASMHWMCWLSHMLTNNEHVSDHTTYLSYTRSCYVGNENYQYHFLKSAVRM